MRPPIATTSTTEPAPTCSPGCILPGAKIEAAFLRSIVQETFTIVDLELVDSERMAELVETYAAFPLATTDMAVVAVAERLGSPKSQRWTAATSTQFGRAMLTASTCCHDHGFGFRISNPRPLRADAVSVDRQGGRPSRGSR